MESINACQRGHRYRASLLHSGQYTSCPRCDRLALVALAYGDRQKPPHGCRLLHFRTEAVTDYQEFCELLSIIGSSYNAFNCSKVVNELRVVFPKLMSVEIGREASPVIYAYVPYWRHQAIEWQGAGSGEPIPDKERKAVATAFLDAMRQADADELTDEGHALRAWWD